MATTDVSVLPEIQALQSGSCEWIYLCLTYFADGTSTQEFLNDRVGSER
jgi:hypothetical protein